MKPKIRTHYLFTALLAALVTSLAPVSAADLTWDHDADGTASDGAGTWLNANQWLDSATPATWNNTTPDNAIIGSGGAGGTITLGAVTAGTVTLNNFSGTYTLSGGSLDQSGGLTVGSPAGSVTISTPVSGTGGLVMSSGGTLTLSSANSFSGGITVNGSTLVASGDSSLGATSSGLTFNGNCIFSCGGSFIDINRTVTVSAGANLSYNTAGQTIRGPVAGSGTITVLNPSQGNPGLAMTNTNNTFTGTLNLTDKGAQGTAAYYFNSLGDGEGAGTISLGFNAANDAQGSSFVWHTGAVAPLVLNHRQFNIGGSFSYIVNNNILSSHANTITINTDLLATGNRNRTLGLDGGNTGDNTIAGSIPDGESNTVLSLSKGGIGKWILSGVNTYTGGTTVNTGTLVLGSTGQLKFAVTDSANTRLTRNGTSVVTLDGSFDIDTSATTSEAVGPWTLVSGSVTYGDTFNVAGFTHAGDGAWFKTIDRQTWIFTQATGQLSLVGPAEILAFGIPGSNGVVDKVAKTVSLTVPWTPWGITGLSSLAPTFTLSSGTCDQTSGAPPTPTFAAANPAQYVVTDGDVSNTYTVTVNVTPPSTETLMTGVYFPGYGFAWASDETNFQMVVPAAASLSGLAPTFSISPLAVVDTASGTARDFTNPQTYTVTAEDGSQTTYTVTVQKITNTGTGTYQQKVLASGPVSYWPLNETSGTTAFDIASGINNITYGGDFGIAPDNYQINQPGLRDDGNPSAQLIMPGANPGIDVSTQAPYHPSLNPLQFTVECWVKPTSTTGQYLVSLQDRTAGGRIGYALWKNNGSAGFGVSGGISTTSTGVSVNGATVAAVGQSYHVVGTYDGTTLRLYVNGNLEGSANLTYMPATAFQPGFSLGSRNGFTASPSYLQDVAVYTRALTQEEILSHYNYNQAGYAAWAATHAPTGGANGDHDGDGVPNGVEYVLGGTKDTNDIGKLPTSSIDGDDMVFSFVRDQASIDGSTTVQIETSTDLVTWDSAPSPYAVPDVAASNIPGVSVAKDSPAAGKDTVTLRIPRAPDASKFARIKVTVP
ncbi:MAG: LamG-like jellyroll fold domain-containing protein [Luteolibacter sp.]